MTYEVIPTLGAGFMHDAARPFALVQVGKRRLVINRYPTRELANAARRRRLRQQTQVR